MGWWKLFTNMNNAEGIREAMRMSYDKHFDLVRSGQLPANGAPHHHIGLFGALGTRYQLRGVGVTEIVIWGSLAPFLAMSAKEGVNALAEYVVLQERPVDAKRAWLCVAINRALRRNLDENLLMLAHIGLDNRVLWCELLEDDVRDLLWAGIARTLDEGD